MGVVFRTHTFSTRRALRRSVRGMSCLVWMTTRPSGPTVRVEANWSASGPRPIGSQQRGQGLVRGRERETERRDGRTRVRRCPEARACDGLRVVLVVVNGEDAVELVRDSIDGVPLGHGHWSEEPLFLNEPT